MRKVEEEEEVLVRFVYCVECRELPERLFRL
jgi:hypothetical protein